MELYSDFKSHVEHLCQVLSREASSHLKLFKQAHALCNLHPGKLLGRPNHPSIYRPSIHLHPPTHPSIHLHPLINPPIILHPFTHTPSILPPTHQSIHPSVIFHLFGARLQAGSSNVYQLFLEDPEAFPDQRRCIISSVFWVHPSVLYQVNVLNVPQKVECLGCIPCLLFASSFPSLASFPCETMQARREDMRENPTTFQLKRQH